MAAKHAIIDIMITLIGILIGLLILTILVVLHELGHFFMARKSGVKVNEFGIGFPPRAIAWVKDPKSNKWVRLPKKDWQAPQKSLVFSINWIPLGGFCAMDGESDSDTKPGTFGSVSFWSKTKILFGGVLMNWLTAIVVLTILAWTGMPHFLENQFTMPGDTKVNKTSIVVEQVLEDSPAAKAGFVAGDQIVRLSTDCTEPEVAIAGTKLEISIADKLQAPCTPGDLAPDTATEVTSFNKDHAGQKVSYTIVRNGETKELIAALNHSDANYLLGVAMSQFGQSLYYHTWSAPIVGIATTAQLTSETFAGLGQMVWNLGAGLVQQFSPDSSIREAGQHAIKDAGDAVSGPVGIIGVIFPAFAEAGITNIAFLAALISVSLACMNVLPIPALDGGRWVLIALFRLRHKKLTKETEEKIVSRAFIVLIVLIILITILDIRRLF